MKPTTLLRSVFCRKVRGLADDSGSGVVSRCREALQSMIEHIADLIAGYGLEHIVYCEVCHFGLGLVVALSVYWLTSTICSAAGVHTRRYSLLLALSLAAVSHVLQDYYIGKF